MQSQVWLRVGRAVSVVGLWQVGYFLNWPGFDSPFTGVCGLFIYLLKKMRNQACSSISVLKQPDLHGKGNLPELPVQKTSCFQIWVFCFVACGLFLQNKSEAEIFPSLKT